MCRRWLSKTKSQDEASKYLRSHESSIVDLHFYERLLNLRTALIGNPFDAFLSWLAPYRGAVIIMNTLAGWWFHLSALLSVYSPISVFTLPRSSKLLLLYITVLGELWAMYYTFSIINLYSTGLCPAMLHSCTAYYYLKQRTVVQNGTQKLLKTFFMTVVEEAFTLLKFWSIVNTWGTLPTKKVTVSCRACLFELIERKIFTGSSEYLNKTVRDFIFRLQRNRPSSMGLVRGVSVPILQTARGDGPVLWSPTLPISHVSASEIQGSWSLTEAPLRTKGWSHRAQCKEDDTQTINESRP